MISTSISKVDIEIRNPLYKNIFLCGGNTMIKGVPERITNEIKKSAPKHTKIMLHAPASRKNSCFTGALIISNLGSFKGMWVTKNVNFIFYLFVYLFIFLFFSFLFFT
jgi:actin-related protein